MSFLRARTPLLLLFIALLLTACSNSLKWTEDVLLPDGRVITLTRYQEFKGPHMPGEQPAESYYWFKFKHPDTGEEVYWEAQTEPGTVALMIEQGVVMLLAKIRSGDGLEDYDCPNPPYLLYRHTNKKWHRIDITEIPLKRLRSNMTYAAGDREKRIKALKHLDTEITKNSTYNHQPWIMDFTDVKQTFGASNCRKAFNNLIVKQPKP